MLRGTLVVAGVCTLLGLHDYSHSSRAWAAGTWSNPGTSTCTGVANAASSHDIPPLCNGPMLCNEPNPPMPPVTGFLPGFYGNSFGRTTYAECDEHFPLFNCHWWGTASAWASVDGIGTSTVQIIGQARADTSNRCECPGWGPITGTGSLDTHIEIKIETAPPGQSVTVYFAWYALLNRSTRHEAGGEDPAYVQGANGMPAVKFEINGISLVPPGTGVNALPGTPNATLFFPASPGQSTGAIAAFGGDTITIDLEAEAGAAISPPPMLPGNQFDQSNASFFGKIVLSIDAPVPAFVNPLTPGANVEPEFSIDIGSDAEMSDPSLEGNEAFDPGDMYRWFGPALPPGGADGLRDDALIFAADFWPVAPDGPLAATGGPSCSAPFPPPVDPILIQSRFDLDGSDAIGAELRFLIPPNAPLASPIVPATLAGASGCLYLDPYLLVSFNDDGAAHYSWNGCSVPSESTADSGATYGSDAVNDEVLMVSTTPIWPPAPGFPQVLVGATSPVLSESSLHPNLVPSADPSVSEQFDDDVDALDVRFASSPCDVWYFSADHEATGTNPAAPGVGLDPGDIYEVLPLGGVTKVIDHAIHLGLLDGTDVDAFEFIWVRRCSPANPTSCQDRLAMLFSVDQDDFLTPADESGGLDPNMIYASFMTDENGDGMGEHFEYLSSPLQDDVDAIAATPLPFVVPGALPPPSNDDCSSALAVMPGTLMFSNVGATTDGPPELCGFTGLPNLDSDVWFRYVAPCTGTSTITISQAAAGPADRLLAVYDSCPPAGGGPALLCASAAGGVPATGTINHFAGQQFVVRSGIPLGLQGDSTLDITVTCTCPADIVGNGIVNVADLLAVITQWGPCPAPCPPHCVADIAPVASGGDCQVNVADLLLVITSWGACP